MTGNISKSKGVRGYRGNALTFEDLTTEQKESLKGGKGDKGDTGNTPSIIFRYDEETGNLYCDSDGILLDKEYVNSQNLATKSYVEECANKVAQTPASITLYANRWVEVTEEKMWYQEVVVANATITEYSKIDLQPSAEQLLVFYEKDLTFVTENYGGTVTVFCIGQKPENNYVIQATITERVIV